MINKNIYLLFSQKNHQKVKKIIQPTNKNNKKKFLLLFTPRTPLSHLLFLSLSFSPTSPFHSFSFHIPCHSLRTNQPISLFSQPHPFSSLHTPNPTYSLPFTHPISFFSSSLNNSFFLSHLASRRSTPLPPTIPLRTCHRNLA